jgi:hypothetical protein
VRIATAAVGNRAQVVVRQGIQRIEREKRGTDLGERVEFKLGFSFGHNRLSFMSPQRFRASSSADALFASFPLGEAILNRVAGILSARRAAVAASRPDTTLAAAAFIGNAALPLCDSGQKFCGAHQEPDGV